MCAYPAINGTPCCGNRWLQRQASDEHCSLCPRFFPTTVSILLSRHPLRSQVLRETFNFTGVMEADSTAIANMLNKFKYTHNWGQTVQAAMVNASVDIAIWNEVYNASLLPAVQQGYVPPASLRESAYRVLEHRFRLGLFDPIDQQAYTTGIWNDTASVHSAAHAQLAYEAALQSMVGECL